MPSVADTAPAAAAPAAPADAAAATTTSRDQKDGPLRKLTTGLLSTYKLINTRYFDAKKAKAKASSTVKEDYVVTAGDMLAGRYKVEESMGKGSFGQVSSARGVARCIGRGGGGAAAVAAAA